MNITINVNITVQQPEIETVQEATIEQFQERIKEARHKAKIVAAQSAEAKFEMIVKRLAYRQRIADKMRTLFGDDTANQFLAGAL
jgi:hypothetical protein